MRIRLLSLALASAALVAACRGGDDAAPQTVTSVAASEIASNTNETAQPLNLNAAAISDADTDETSPPTPVN